MQYIDTSPAAIERRALESMAEKHGFQLDTHELRFGKLGELMTKEQKRRLKRTLAEQAEQPKQGKS